MLPASEAVKIFKSLFTSKGNFPNLNHTNQCSLLACLRTDNFSSFAAVHNLFTQLPDKLTDFIVAYNDATAKFYIQKSYQESEPFCISSSLTRALQQSTAEPLCSYHTTFRKNIRSAVTGTGVGEPFYQKTKEIWKFSYTLETEKLDPFTKQLPDLASPSQLTGI